MGNVRTSENRSRRGFLKAAAVASAALATRAVAQSTTSPTASPSTQPATAPVARRRPAAAVPPLPALGNGEQPAMQFQAYPGGTGAYLEKLVRDRGTAAFNRWVISPEPWNGEVPTNEEDIAFLPVHRLASLIQAKKLSPVDLTRIYLDRLKKFDPILLCAVTILEGPATEAAQQAESDIKSGNYKGPLHGIPWGVKDLFAVKGTKTTWGATEYKDRVIDEDAEVVTRLTNAGAILIAKLASGRFAMGDQWYRGRTNNPWNVAVGSSGSSAGPASATAAGCVAFGIGTETRGSIMSPANVCGISALRPTFGRVSRSGGMVLAWSMDRVGPLCRTIEDCAIVFSVIHGSDEKDPSTLTAPFDWQRSPDISKFRIGYDRTAPVDFINKLKELGAILKTMPARPPVPRGMDSLTPESAAAFDGLLASGELTDNETPWGAPGTGRFTEGRQVPAIDFIKVQRHREILVHKMADVMADFDMYISNTDLGDRTLTSMTGHPAVVLPCGFGPRRNQPPQVLCTNVVGALFAEDKILSLASAYQRATKWHEQRPKLTV